MKIGIDYTSAMWQGAGIGRYTRELVRSVVMLDPNIDYRLFYAARGLDENSPWVESLRKLCTTFRNVRAVPLPFSPRLLTILWQRLRIPLPVELYTGPLDLVHALDFVLPPTFARTMVTIHDLTFLVHPECAEPALANYLNTAVRRSLKRASMVLVDSQATRADVTRLLGTREDRTRLVYPGVSAAFRPVAYATQMEVRERLNLPPRFILFVGTLEPRKNLSRLLEAFDHLIAHGAHPGLHLVIAGKPGWRYEPIYETYQRLGLGERVKFLDFVADEDLPALYNLASVFVYPSIYEGFGLPVLEALACGAPVVTSNVSSIPEVTGSAAILVDPHQIESISAGISRALGEIEHLRLGGPLQARRFSWEDSARELLACYREFMA